MFGMLLQAINQKKIDSEVIKDISWYTASRILPAGLNFSAIILFVHIFGDEAFARYSTLLSLCLALATVASGWLNQAQMRKFSFTHTRENISTVLTGASLSALLGLFLLLAYTSVNSTYSSSLNILTAALVIIAIIFYNSALYNLMADLKAKKAGLFEVIRSAIFFLIPIALSIFNKDTSSILLGVLFSYGALGSYFLIANWKNLRRKYINWNLLYELFKFGWPYSVLLSLLDVSRYIERTLLLENIAPKEAGQYIATSELILRTFSLVYAPIILAIHPRYMSHYNDKNTSSAASLLKNAAYGKIIIFILFAGALASIGPTVFSKLISGSSPSVSLLLTIATAGFVWQLSGLIQKPLEAAKKSKTMLLIYSLSFLLQITLNFFLVKKISVYAGPVSMLTAGLVYIILVSSLCRFKMGSS